MCVCMCIYINTYAQTHTHIYICIHIDTYKYIHTYIRTYIHTSVRPSMQACRHACIHRRGCVCVCLNSHVYMYVDTAAREMGFGQCVPIRNPVGKRNKRCLQPRSTRMASSSALQCQMAGACLTKRATYDS